MAAFTVAELENMVIVNMGDYKTAKGEKKLMTKDLGSCVGVALRDPHTGVGLAACDASKSHDDEQDRFCCGKVRGQRT